MEPLSISQIALVVEDIEEALERYHRVLGWGPWNVYEHKPPLLHHTRVRGKDVEYTMIGAETHVGPIVVELIQPVSGPSIYAESSRSTARACTTSRSCARRPRPRRRPASGSWKRPARTS